MTTTSDSPRYEPCRSCRRETKHLLVTVRRVPDPERPHDYVPYEAEYHTYELLECCGCETVTLKYSYGQEATNHVDIHYYPPAISRPIPTWLWNLPPDLASLLREVYAALATDSPRLALMGARAVVDMVAAHQVGDAGTFGKKLDLLEQADLLSRLSREQLAAAFDAGSAAMHRGHKPSAESVGQVLDIVENVIQAVYVLPNTAQAVARSTPPRPKAPKP